MWEAIGKFFEGQSALANFLQIGGAVVAIGLAVWRGAKWIQGWRLTGRLTTISAWLEGRSFGPSAARSLRTAVVDDRPDDYPLDTLRRLGYSIIHIGHLNLSEVPSLLTYDCVLLDINGVLEEDSKRGGLEVLKRIKTPDGPYVVAVSSRGFDITMSEFFMLADHRLKKPIPPAEVEGIIERAFESRFSAKHAAQRIDEAAAFATSRSRASRKALKMARRYLELGAGLDDANEALALVVPGERLPAALMDLQTIRRSLNRAP